MREVELLPWDSLFDADHCNVSPDSPTSARDLVTVQDALAYQELKEKSCPKRAAK